MRRGVIFLVMFVPLFSLSQEENFSQEYSFSIGIAPLSTDKHIDNKELDFMNYINSNDHILEYLYVKLGYSCDFSTDFSTDFKLILMSDLAPDNFDFSGYYNFNYNLGIGIGSMMHKYYVSYFEQYVKANLEKRFYLLDNNQHQIETYDWSFYISPFYNFFVNKNFEVKLKGNLGLSYFLKKGAKFAIKKEYGNERQTLEYKTRITPQVFINPRMELKIKLFNISNCNIGLIQNTNLYYAKRSINYDKNIQKWTPENIQTKIINPSKHNFFIFETEMGLFVRW